MESRIKECRLRRGLSQKEMALDLDMPQSMVSRWELGIRVPTKEGYKMLSDYFGVSVDWLMGLTDDETRYTPTQAHVSDEDIKLALWGDAAREITDEQLAEVRRFARYIAQRGDNDDRRN